MLRKQKEMLTSARKVSVKIQTIHKIFLLTMCICWKFLLLQMTNLVFSKCISPYASRK